MTQRMQLAIQNHIIRHLLTDSDRFSVPFTIRLLECAPFLRWLPVRMIGLGFRPEHVYTAALATTLTSAVVR